MKHFKIIYHLTDHGKGGNVRLKYKSWTPNKRTKKRTIWYMQQRHGTTLYFDKISPHMARIIFDKFFYRLEVKIETTIDYEFWA